MTKRNFAFGALALALLLAATTGAAAQPKLLVLDFEFIEEMHDPRSVEADQNRLQISNEALRMQLSSCPAVDLVDPAPAEDAINQARSRNKYVHRCNGCGEDIGRAADAQFVLFPWVQKVSNLILNLNAEIRATETDEVVAVRSVDLRGNTDRGWLRATKALAIRLCELDSDRLNRATHR